MSIHTTGWFTATVDEYTRNTIRTFVEAEESVLRHRATTWINVRIGNTGYIVHWEIRFDGNLMIRTVEEVPISSIGSWIDITARGEDTEAEAAPTYDPDRLDGITVSLDDHVHGFSIRADEAAERFTMATQPTWAVSVDESGAIEARSASDRGWVRLYFADGRPANINEIDDAPEEPEQKAPAENANRKRKRRVEP